jgi:hypothetical protein
VGHNLDALKNPPIIYASAGGSDPVAAYLLLPQKNADGTLNIPNKQQVCAKCLQPIPHSGEGTQVLSDGDDVYVVYGEPILGLSNTDPIFKRGMPTYITKFNRTSKIFSTPVLLGYGGIDSTDGHNWAVLANDSQGVIHVIINGHHDPFIYTKSLAPHDISQWTSPVASSGPAARTSYLGLLIDNQDTLYAISRNSTENYRFDLALHRLKVGGNWEVKHLVSPYKNNYRIMYHNLTIDPITQRLFLSYNSQTVQEYLWGDDIEMFIYQRPDFSPLTLNKDGTENYTPSLASSGGTQNVPQYLPWWDERVILTSADGGDSWRFALSQDLNAPAGCTLDANLICK